MSSRTLLPALSLLAVAAFLATLALTANGPDPALGQGAKLTATATPTATPTPTATATPTPPGATEPCCGTPTATPSSTPAACPAGTPSPASGTTERVNEANNTSQRTAITPDGRYVAFDSLASNLVAGDTGNMDVFVHDRQAGTTERVSIRSDGQEANNWSDTPRLSADGRFVAFYSSASNLVPNDTNNTGDVFVHDRQTGTTEIVSVANDGTLSSDGGSIGDISADGRFVAFSSFSSLVPGDTNNAQDGFLRDRLTGVTERVTLANDGSQGNAGSGAMDISPDGRFVVFASNASNLVPGDTNGGQDIFVRDRQLGITERVNLAYDGSQVTVFSPALAAISADGRFVAFQSDDPHLVPGDTNGRTDVFIRDRQSATTERVSVGNDGSQGQDNSYGPTDISADGRFVAFHSRACTLVGGDTSPVMDGFIRDRLAATTERVTLANDGSEGNQDSLNVHMSSDLGFLAFESYASNLVPGDTNGTEDIFVRHRTSTPTPTATATPTPTPTPTATPTPTVTPTPTPTATATATPTPPADSDGDGWSDSAEAIIGTNPLLRCGVNAWPPDINNDTFVDISDVSAVAGFFGQSVPPGPPRSNIAPDPPDGFIDITDVSRMTGLFGMRCQP
jgi:Tol biopolymer transport system component